MEKVTLTIMTDLEGANQHKFWNKAPVVQLNEKPATIGVIDSESTVETVRKTPYPLPKGFSWCIVDTQEETNRNELYEFLRNHYVSHPSQSYKFAYSAEFLDWALHPPGWNSEWLVGVRTDATNKLVAFISAIPITIDVKGDTLNIAAVDFLSVHTKLRGKNLAPLLIQEVQRRINLTGIFTAIYTAGKLLTQPVTKARYRHRLVNYEKLLAIHFTSIKAGEDKKKLAKYHAVPKTTLLPGFRPMTEADVPQVHVKLNEFLGKYAVKQQFSEEEVRHWFLPRKDIVGSYVVENKNEIESFVSFYVVPSTVTGVPEYDNYVAAYLFYYFAKPSKLTDVCRAAVEVAAHEYHADVINCLNILDNKNIISSLRFVEGDGNLHYYLWNYAVPEQPPEQCGVVLL